MALMSISTSGVLHRDKLSWFCHIEAPTLRFLVWTLRVLGEDGFRADLGAAAIDETSGSGGQS
jgi:hypothetical protein